MLPESLNLLDNQVLLFIAAIIVLALISTALKKGRLLFTIPIKFIVGGLMIYIINLLASKVVDFSIPLNPLTALIVGLLELPGLALVLMIKYLIYPM